MHALKAHQGQCFGAAIHWLLKSVGQTVALSVSVTIGRYPNFFCVPGAISADDLEAGRYVIALSEVSSNTSQWIEGANKLTISILDGGTGEVIDIQTLIVHVYAN